MGLLECVSCASVWRGYDYFKEKKVVSIEEIGKNIYSAAVAGSSSDPYSVELHIDHPRKSKCNCPHANGKRIICKHMISLYFVAYPKAAQKYYDDVIAYQEAEEARQEELEEKIIDYVCKLKKNDLQNLFLELLYNGPEWQYERFIREYIE